MDIWTGYSEDYLLQSAIHDAQLYLSDALPPISGGALESLAKQYLQVDSTVTRLTKRYERVLLEALLTMPTMRLDEIAESEAMEWVETMLSVINSGRKAEEKITGTVGSEAGYGRVVTFYIRTHGMVEPNHFTEDFFRSAEYAAMMRLRDSLDGLIEPGAEIRRGEKHQPVKQFADVVDWLMREAKRGQQIQRYKGLGEMNPEQLWDTTMNPETRRMLQVNIEDAIAADEIFTTLMGELVEPRREFIEENALLVSNLDV